MNGECRGSVLEVASTTSRCSSPVVGLLTSASASVHSDAAGVKALE